MQKYSRAERCARRLLLLLSYVARFLGVLHGRLERRRMVVQRMQRCSKLTAIALRVFITLSFSAVFPQMLDSFFDAPASYVRLLGRLQAASVSVFAILCFVLQTRGERQAIAVLNRFIRLFEGIAAKIEASRAPSMLGGRFLGVLLLKMTLTVVAYPNEVRKMLPLGRNGMNPVDYIEWVSALFGVYLWLGSMLVLDISCLGFLLIAEMYRALGDHLRRMLLGMERIEEAGQGGGWREKLSRYSRMQLLCESADRIDATGACYAELYELAGQFHAIFQWQILYYIYYNFVVVLLLLHQAIFLYIHSQRLDIAAVGMVAVKIANLAVLVLCADHALQQWRLPELLRLDIACAGIDVRWDESVEQFLGRRMTENLEFKVLGFFRLNNGFILLVLSAIIAYLFVLIQFGVSGAFEENGLVKAYLDSH